jgi:hypothetical protein
VWKAGLLQLASILLWPLLASCGLLLARQGGAPDVACWTWLGLARKVTSGVASTSRSLTMAGRVVDLPTTMENSGTKAGLRHRMLALRKKGGCLGVGGSLVAPKDEGEVQLW